MLRMMKKIVCALLLAVVCCGVFSCNEKPKSYRFVKVTNDGKEEVENIEAKNDTDALNLYFDRMEKIILSAAKQSLTPYLPVLHELTPYADFIRAQAHKDQQNFIAHCYKEDKRVLKEEIEKGRDVLVLIGPEGDFSEQEVADALTLGYVPVSLGNSRLRTETAGVVACHTAVLLNE
jgi:16S rRNA (uracil1498-N3)-methyltransferase